MLSNILADHLAFLQSKPETESYLLLDHTVTWQHMTQKLLTHITSSSHPIMSLCIKSLVANWVLMSESHLSIILTTGSIQHHHISNLMSIAIFHYVARSEAGERFKVCISTPEMDTAARLYGHHSQIILDGTFGVCSIRLLLFISMAIDEKGKGVPIAFFLFSAPTGNWATHAGYNTSILQKLLAEWKDHLSTGFKEPFQPFVAITDTNTKECGALLVVWPSICLLICKFHLRQCWTNNHKKILKFSVQGKDFWKDHVRDQLHGLEEEYVYCYTVTACCCSQSV